MAEKKESGENAKLRMWKDRWTKALSAYSSELTKIGERDEAYHGSVKPRKAYVENDKDISGDTHRRNIIYELIETQIDSAIPQPKVTAKRKEDEILARTIEDMLRGELDRLSFEIINDRAERMSPIQGGCFYLCEWDETQRSHTTVGENLVTLLNPKQVIPQPGVTELEEMDYVFIRLSKTKEYIKNRYHVEFDEQDAEEDPGIREAEEAGDTTNDLITQYIVYYRGKDGVIGMYSWALDTELCDLEDYQSRKKYVCADCGSVVPPPSHDGSDRCPACGSTKIIEDKADDEFLTRPLVLSDGRTIPADELNPVRVPFYKPDIFPVIVQRNVSEFSQFLGGSDVDMIYDQQATTNRVSSRIIEKLLTGGSLTTLPSDASIRTDNAIGKTLPIQNAADKDKIGQFDLTCDVSQEMAFLAQVYEEARQTLGITDSFQGRDDSTATSKVAKEFAAKQSAGRLESKRQMKNFAYSKLFEVLFKFRLAYADEPRPVLANNSEGNRVYEEFDRYDFLKMDDSGELYWNDDFTFSVDASSPLASNREAMWQETRMNFESGAFGDPASLETLILFWNKMEMLHYPGAGETKRYLLDLKEQQQAMAAQQMNAQQEQMNGLMSQIDERARQDAQAASEAQAEEEAAKAQNMAQMGAQSAENDPAGLFTNQ